MREIATSSKTSVSSRTIVVLNAFFLLGRFIVTVTTPSSSRATSNVSMALPYRPATVRPMGYNPFRASVKHRGDMVIVAAALIVIVALVGWALFGS